MSTQARGHTSLTALLAGMVAALILILTPARAAGNPGYLRVSGPAPIRFQPSNPAPQSDPITADTLASEPIPSSAPPSPNPRVVPPIPVDGASLEAASETYSQYWSDALITRVPGTATDSLTDTIAAPDPIHSLLSPDPSPSASTPTQLRQSDSIGIITPQSILPLILDATTDPTVRVAIVTPLSFVPPQPSPGARSSATYSVTP